MCLQEPPRVSSGAVESAYILLDALRALGLRHLVISPGSRSAPLVYAAHALLSATQSGNQEEPADQEGSGEQGEPGDPARGVRGRDLVLHVRHDERAAAFTALGLSKAGEVAAVVTTSGTATSYLLGAIMEAHHSATPLVAITADRPAELRGTQANQTTVQPGLFAPFTVANVDLPAAAATRASTTELQLAADTAARSWAAAVAAPGPVHINMAFRDPLTPGPASEAEHQAAHEPAADAPLTIAVRVGFPAPPPTALTVDSRTLVVAGDATASTGDMAARFASALNLPLLAEPSSGARAPGAPLVPAYPLALAEVMADPQHPLRPREVVVVGHPTLSRPVIRDLCGASDVVMTVVSERLEWPDPQRRAERVVTAVDPALSRTSPQAAPSDGDAVDEAPQGEVGAEGFTVAFTEGWLALGERLHEDALAKASAQARAALAVWETCAEDAAGAENAGSGSGPGPGPGPGRLVLGASALIRDLEIVAGPMAASVYANRGLAGIDGTVATATGIALAAPRGEGPAPRTRVLLGDISALHDLTGFLLGPGEPEPDLDIVVVDDDGGRIFGGLEHAKAPVDMLERFFTTPHGRDMGQVIESLGVPVTRVAADDLRGALRSASHLRGRRAFLVRIPRQSPGCGD